MIENRGRKKSALCCPPVAGSAQPRCEGPRAGHHHHHHHHLPAPEAAGAGRWRPPRRVAAHARGLCLAVAVAAGRGSGLAAHDGAEAAAAALLPAGCGSPAGGRDGPGRVGRCGWVCGELSVTTGFLACAPCSCGAQWGRACSCVA